MSGSRAMANTGPFGNLFLLPGAICGGRVDSFAWKNVLFPGAKTISGAYFQPVTIPMCLLMVSVLPLLLKTLKTRCKVALGMFECPAIFLLLWFLLNNSNNITEEISAYETSMSGF